MSERQDGDLFGTPGAAGAGVEPDAATTPPAPEVGGEQAAQPPWVPGDHKTEDLSSQTRVLTGDDWNSEQPVSAAGAQSTGSAVPTGPHSTDSAMPTGPHGTEQLPWPPPMVDAPSTAEAADGWAGDVAAPAPSTNAASGRKRVVGAVMAGLAIAVVAGAAGGVVGYQAATDSTPVVAAPQSGAGASAPADGSVAAVAAAVTPAVVNIEAAGNGQAGTGSGFIIQSDGYILTNHHVIAGAENVAVNFSDGTSAAASIVGSDEGYDLAVIKVDKTNLPVVALGSSDALNVGDTAIAVGSPLGLSGTVTSGIVSALDRPVTAGTAQDTSFINAIQTDAAINPGNSGGPLLNGDGEVVGVNSAIATLGQSVVGGQTGSIGLGFSIPIDTASRIADEIIETGSASTPVLGIQIDSSADGQGVAVVSVSPGGPAAEAGLIEGDVIVSVEGQPVTDSTQLIVTIRDYAVGEAVSVTVERGGREVTEEVTLAASDAIDS